MILGRQARWQQYRDLAGFAATVAKTSVSDQVQSLCGHETDPAPPTQ